MRTIAMMALGVVMWHSAAPAQTTNSETALTGGSDAGSTNGLVGAGGIHIAPEFTPLTTSERMRLYLTSTFGPGAIARAIASGGIAQWSNSPKEWKGGTEAFGERVGNSFAEHVIRKTLESGAAAVLHEDNRYIRSGEGGFWRRTKHAVGSTFVTRNNAGGEHFAYSRFGGALGASFISREWQPRSLNTSGDASVNFGITMATDIGWNVFREFRPLGKRR